MLGRILVIATLFMSTTFSIYAANLLGKPVYAPYQEYYNNDENYPILTARQGWATYMDRSSIVALQDDEKGILFAYNWIEVNFDKPGHPVTRYGTRWYYHPWSETNAIYIKSGQNSQWDKFLLTDKRGLAQRQIDGFLIGWKVLKGTNYRI